MFGLMGRREPFLVCSKISATTAPLSILNKYSIFDLYVDNPRLLFPCWDHITVGIIRITFLQNFWCFLRAALTIVSFLLTFVACCFQGRIYVMGMLISSQWLYILVMALDLALGFYSSHEFLLYLGCSSFSSLFAPISWFRSCKIPFAIQYIFFPLPILGQSPSIKIGKSELSRILMTSLSRISSCFISPHSQFSARLYNCILFSYLSILLICSIKMSPFEDSILPDLEEGDKVGHDISVFQCCVCGFQDRLCHYSLTMQEH